MMLSFLPYIATLPPQTSIEQEINLAWPHWVQTIPMQAFTRSPTKLTNS